MADDEAVRRRFADALDSSRETIVERVVERSAAGVPDYEYLKGIGDDSLGQNTAKHLAQFARGVRTLGERLDPDGLSHELAMTRAVMGLPLSSILRAFQVAGASVWEWTISEVRAGRLPAETAEVIWPLWLRYVDEAAQGSADAYIDWERARSQEERQSERRIMMGIVRGDIAELEGRKILHGLGLDIERGLSLSIVRSSPVDDQMPSDLVMRVDRAVRRSGGPQGSEVVIAVRDSDMLILHAAEAGEPDGPPWLEESLRGVDDCHGATSGPCRAVRDLHAEVARTDRAARAAAFGRTIARSDDVNMIDHALVALHADSALLLPRFVAVLDAPEGVKDWRSTVIAWAESSWRPSQAARELGIHQNTVYYRLAQIESKTGLDLHDAKQAMSLYLAARLAGPR